MDSMFNTFSRGTTRVRLFHCTILAIFCFIFLGYLLSMKSFSFNEGEADVSPVGNEHQLGRTDNSSIRNDSILAAAPTKVAAAAPRVATKKKSSRAPIAPRVATKKKSSRAPIAPRVATKKKSSRAPIAPPAAGRKEGSLTPVAPPNAARKEESLPPGVQIQTEPEAVDESDSGEGEQNEDKEGDQGNGDQDDHGTLRVTARVNSTDNWDTRTSAGCEKFRKSHPHAIRSRSLQNPRVDNCSILQKQHVSVLVKQWTWVPESLNNLYSCDCGLTCLWTNSEALAENPDAHLYESNSPPESRQKGEPWRVYIDLEAGRNRAPSQDLFISYHAEADVQVTYASGSFYFSRTYYISPTKNDEVLVYWSSSRCVEERQRIATELLQHLPHHSFGKCLNNVNGLNVELSMYPRCRPSSGAPEPAPWTQRIHCTMSHYKFALAIENTMTDSYVTEKLFFALDAGTVPIYFGAPNVLDLVPPHSIIVASQFKSMRQLAQYVKRVAADPVLYAEYHAWRRCGVMGPYGDTRALSLDSLPCRLCATLSQLGGRNA